MHGKYQTYSEYKDSGVEWLGEVPEHWDVSPIKYLSDFVGTGGTPKESSSFSDVKEVYWFTPGDFNDKGILLESAKHVTNLSCKNGDAKLYQGGSVLVIGIGATLGKVGYCLKKFSCNQQVNILTPNTKTNVIFMMYSLSIQSEQMKQLSNASTIGILNQDKTKLIQITAPSIHEQIQIANFLDHETFKIDTLIEKQQQLIKLLKEKRQAVISHAVTKGLNPDAPMKDTGVEWYGEVPEHWDITEIRYIANQIGGGTPSKDQDGYWNGDIPWVSPKDMKVDYIDDSQDKITGQAVNDSSAKLIPKGSVLIVVRGMILIHSIPVALTMTKLTINQDMKALIPVYNVYGEYLLFLLKGLRGPILDLVDSSAHGTKCLRTEIFERMKIATPNINEQKGIIAQLKNKLEGIDALFEKTYLAIELLKERRTAIISAAVTGKIDVRNWKALEQNRTNKEDSI